MRRQAMGFMDVLPTLDIVDGMVHIGCADGTLVCTPSLFRRLVEAGGRKLDRWEAERREPVPFSRRKK